MNTTETIRKLFDIREGDTLPYTGFLKTTRNELAKLFAELRFTSGAEIGVCSGEYSEVLLSANPELRLLCIDPWVRYWSPWQFWVTTERAENRFQRAQERLAPFKNVEFIRKSSVAAAQDVKDKSLDFVYIDGLHDFDNAMLDLIAWVPKIKAQGIVAGHDFLYMYGCQVPAVVEAYTRAHAINEWYLTRERSPSWFWVQR